MVVGKTHTHTYMVYTSACAGLTLSRTSIARWGRRGREGEDAKSFYTRVVQEIKVRRRFDVVVWRKKHPSEGERRRRGRTGMRQGGERREGGGREEDVNGLTNGGGGGGSGRRG